MARYFFLICCLKVCSLLFLPTVMASTHTMGSKLEDVGSVSPSSFGAKGDGIHDDTEEIQKALDFLDKTGGGTLYFDSGTYMISSIKLGKKTSLVGCGNGATLIKQIKGTRQDCVIIPSSSAALRIAHLSIVGNDVNAGLIVENSKYEHENQHYLYTKTIKSDVPQPFKWINIDDICVFHFGVGLQIELWGFNINVCNSTFSYNNTGVIMRCTDSSMYNCYITNNKKDGLLLSGSNNKISNVKSIFNGGVFHRTSAAISVQGSRCQLINCETQDNHCKGFYIVGQYNLLSNCISNTDGYLSNTKGYDSSIEACGFRIEGLYNSFSNCAVTSYIDKYGATYFSPVTVDSTALYYYTDIFDDIKVLIAKDRLLFNEPFRNVQTLSSKNRIKNANIETINRQKYFDSSSSAQNIIELDKCNINSLSILADVNGEGGQVLSVGNNKELILSIIDKSIALFWKNEKKAVLSLDKDAILNKDDIRLIVSFYQNNNKITSSILCYERTSSRGWIKKEVRKDVDIPTMMISDAEVRFGDTNMKIKRLAISNTPMPESVYMPYSNTNRVYDFAFIYVDADSYNMNDKILF